MVEDIINKIPQEVLLRGVIASNMKLLREEHGITQEELATQTGINRVTITRYETSQVSVSLLNLLKISKALGVEPSALLKGWEKII